jgi:hypothetical protein
MRAVLVLFGAVALCLGGAFSLQPAEAATPNPQCVQDAKDVYKECRTACREEFQAAKDGCRDVNHDCAEACRLTFSDCVKGVMVALEGCKQPCLDDLVADIAQCRTDHAGDPAALDDCIDAAQVAAFMCRDACRETVQVGPELKQCRMDHRTCIRACPPAGDPWTP